MADKAMRHNDGKLKYSMLDLTCLGPAVEVLMFGAKKYARDNWKRGLPISEVLDSLLRHVAAIQRGEFIDPESGLSHIGHIQCNALFLGNPKASMDIEADNLKVKEEVNLAKTLTDDELGFTNMRQHSVPVSMADYDAFVYALDKKSEPNEKLNRLMGTCAPWDYNRGNDA
jgi:hypothetical protein